MSFEVGSRIAIDPGDVDRVAGAMWISLKAHGYRSNTGRELTSGSAIQPPAPSQSVQAAHDGYRAEVTANYAGKFVEVDIVTPCLSSS